MNFEKTIDITIFGATGFTGSRVCLYYAERDRDTFGTPSQVFSWALAGRNEQLLSDLKMSIIEKYGTNFENLPIIVADTKDGQSMADLCGKTRLLLNCVGPFRYHGDITIKACIENKCDYLDITGEPDFITKMSAKYHQQAKENNVFVVHACGFDSIPADLGSLYTEQQFRRHGAVCSSIDSFFTINAPSGFSLHYTTFKSGVNGFARQGELSKLRKVLKASRKDENGEIVRIKRIGKRQTIYDKFVHFSKLMKLWCYPFVFADSSVVRNSQTCIALFEKANSLPQSIHPYYAAYLSVTSRKNLFISIIFVSIFVMLVPFRFGRYLLLNFPRLLTYGIFSRKGPSEKQLKDASFTMTFFGKGFQDRNAQEPDTEITTKISSCEPAYETTVIILYEAARCFLEERQKIVNPPTALQPVEGGVYTPGFVFRDTSLIKRLNRSGVQFTVESQPHEPVKLMEPEQTPTVSKM